MGRPKKYNTEEERIAAKRASKKRYREKNKGKIAEYGAKWRELHPEYNAEYYQSNKEKITEHKIEYYQNNKEEILAKKAEWRKENKDKITKYNDDYSQKNREKLAKRMVEYNKTQKGRAVNLVSSYRASDILSNRGECTIDAQWIVDNVFSGQCCHYCGESDWMKLGVDRKDSSLPHTPENCVPCCKRCNELKHTTEYADYMRQIGKIV